MRIRPVELSLILPCPCCFRETRRRFQSYALAINNSRQIVGSSSIDDYPFTT
jgi:hypothetical protein